VVEAPEDGDENDAPGSSLTAIQWFHLASEMEDESPVEARRAYLQALELDPGLADAHLNLGRLEHEAGELGKAEAHYRDAVRCAPDDPTCHYNLGVLLEDRKRPDEALHAYRQALERDPDLGDAHYNLGLLLESRGRKAEAIRHLMRARQLYEHAGV
jgi:tetratricopeptide (TPR) repeat protein